MLLEILVLIIIVSGIIWLFGGGGLVMLFLGGCMSFITSCLLLYITFAIIHKLVGPFIFG